MGFGDAVGPFVGLEKEHFQLTDFMATLIQFVGVIMFFFLSIPMGIYQDKKGKKHVLLLGLVVALIRLIIPISVGLESYSVFLITILLLAGGAFLPPIMGIVADNTSVLVGFLVPTLAVLYIGWLSLKSLKS